MYILASNNLYSRRILNETRHEKACLYAPNFDKVGRAYCFGLACLSVCLLTFDWCMLRYRNFIIHIPHEKDFGETVNARDLKFHNKDSS